MFRNDTLISSYGYDSNGNRLFHATQTDTLFGNYDNQDRMLSYGNTGYSYNARGSLTFKAENGDTTFYTYDLMGNLTNVILPNGDLIEYLIDVQNRRVGKKLNGVVQKQWIYQDQLNPIAEFNGNGNLITRFVYGDKGHVPAYMVKNDSTYRFITDHLGSVRFVVNYESGYIAQQISYDEFGNVLSNTNPDFQPFAYAGGLYDSQTKLVRFGARDYDPETGRWTAKDPIFFGGLSFNLYTYVFNNPILYIDTDGLRDTPFPVNGVVINNSQNTVTVIDYDRREVKDVKPGSHTPWFTRDYDFVCSTDSDWKKIGPNKVKVDKNGNIKNYKRDANNVEKSAIRDILIENGRNVDNPRETTLSPGTP